MNISILRIVPLLAAMAALCFADAAHAQRRDWVTCPVWNASGSGGIFSSVEAAAREGWKEVGGDQCPGSAVVCTPIYENPATYSCIWTFQASNFCLGTSYGMGVQYPYPPDPFPGSPGTASEPVNDHGHCATFLPEDPKNNGHCDECKGKCPGCQGNPVNIGTGNKFQQEVDLASAGPGGLEFTRFYNSRGGSAGSDFALNWTHTYSRSLLKVTVDQISAKRDDGKVLWFTQSGGAWLGDPDNPEVLQSTASGYTLTSRNDDVETYDANGHLLSLANRAGLATTLLYGDASSPRLGGLVKVTDSFGRSLTFGYDAIGRRATMTDPSGAVYRYGYDAGGNLTSVAYPADLNGGTGPIRTYVYNESANNPDPVSYNVLTGIVDENGTRFATYKYDYTSGKAIDSEHALGADAYTFTYNTSPHTYTSPLGATFSYTTQLIQGVQQVDSTTQNCPGCGGTSTESYTFDVNRNVASHTDFNGNLACYGYDLARNLETSRTEGLSGSGNCTSRVTTSATRTVTTEWHPTFRIQKRIAEPLRITTFTFNGDSGVSCAPAGTSIAVPCSKTVQATTDHDGSQAFAGAADGAPRVWAYTYNSLAQVLTVDGPRTDVADVTTYTYSPSGDRLSVVNALGQTTQFTLYDGDGRLLKMIDPNGMETILTYAPRGWLASRQIGTAAAGYETTTYDYDNLGQLKKVTQPDLSFVAYTYDDAHRMTMLQDGLGNKISYTLDAAGNRIAEQSFDTTGALVRAHSRVIDVLNRLAQDIGGTSPGTQITQYAYDGNSNVTSITDPLSRVTTQIYDARNRMVEVRDPFNGSAAPTKYEYDGRDQLTKVTDPASLATTYRLNGHGELLTQASPDTGNTAFTDDFASNVITKLDARGVLATYSYDALNRVKQITFPDETVVYTYDSCANGVGRLCTVTDASGSTSYSYDVKGRVTAKAEVVGTVTLTTGYAYNAVGQLATVTTPGGRSVTYGYANNRPVSVSVVLQVPNVTLPGLVPRSVSTLAPLYWYGAQRVKRTKCEESVTGRPRPAWRSSPTRRSLPKTGCRRSPAARLLVTKSERPVASSTRDGLAKPATAVTANGSLSSCTLAPRTVVSIPSSSTLRIERVSPRPNCTYESPAVTSRPGDAYVTHSLAG